MHALATKYRHRRTEVTAADGSQPGTAGAGMKQLLARGSGWVHLPEVHVDTLQAPRGIDCFDGDFFFFFFDGL